MVKKELRAEFSLCAYRVVLSLEGPTMWDAESNFSVFSYGIGWRKGRRKAVFASGHVEACDLATILPRMERVLLVVEAPSPYRVVKMHPL
jgi:hypothetical protein